MRVTEGEKHKKKKRGSIFKAFKLSQGNYLWLWIFDLNDSRYSRLGGGYILWRWYIFVLSNKVRS
jgi:hypothetical protein